MSEAVTQIIYAGEKINLSPKDVARFWRKVDKSKECWEWTCGRFDDGYGGFWIQGKTRRAHKVAFLLSEPIPEGLFVCHRCDNPICVRREHLFLGTVKENSDDMVRKGRAPKGPVSGEWLEKIRAAHPRGERAWNSRLSEADVREIRMAANRGEPKKEIAARFRISKTNVSAIVSRRLWRHVE